MSQPSPDRVDIDTHLKEAAGGCMANYVRTDSLPLERRHRDTELRDVALDERMNAVACQRFSPAV
jgi:hypothetical protein